MALKEFYFGGCKFLKKIMEGLGGLTSLKKLYIEIREVWKNFERECPHVWLEGIAFW